MFGDIGLQRKQQKVAQFWRLRMIVFAACLGMDFHVQAQDEGLARIRSTGIIKLGIRDTAAPFASIKDGVPLGFSVDLCNQAVKGIEKALGQTLKRQIVPTSITQQIEHLKTGEADLICGATTNTQERAKEALFSYAIFVTGVRLAVATQHTDADIRAMSGKRVAVVAGSTAERIINSELRLAQSGGRAFSLLTVPTNDAGVQAVADGKVDAFSTDDVLLAGAIARTKLAPKVKRDGKLLSIEPYGLVMRKGEDALAAIVNGQLRELMTSGAIEPIFKQWFNTAEMAYSMNYLTREAYHFPQRLVAYP